VPRRRAISHLLRKFSPLERAQARVLRRFYDSLGFVSFGNVSQHDDAFDAIRGFTASLTHRDEQYGVGSFNGFDIRIVNRADTSHRRGTTASLALWTIIELELRVRSMPHIFFLPTGVPSDMFAKLFAEQPYMQPISSFSTTEHMSPEFHGRYQILGRSTRVHDIEGLITSPVSVGIGTHFWPHAIEIEHGKLYVYLPDRTLTKAKLEQALTASVWLATLLRDIHTDVLE